MNSIRAAAVDIGSNTVLFLVGDVDSKGKVSVVDEALFASGFGRDVFNYGHLAEETIVRNIAVLRALKLRAESRGASTILCCGTSAVRNAANSREFADRVKRELDLKVEIISGEEEARLTYLGYLSGIEKPESRIYLIDIGGGSCEVIAADGIDIVESVSLDIGAVRLTEKIPLGDPPDESKYPMMEKEALSELAKLEPLTPSWGKLVFSGGTVTALAALELGLDSYSGGAIEGFPITIGQVKSTQERFLSMSLSERRRLLSFEPDRARVIIAGTAIVLAFMKYLKLGMCNITHRGLRFGLLANLSRR